MRHFSKARDGAPTVVLVLRLKETGVILRRAILATRRQEDRIIDSVFLGEVVSRILGSID